MQRQAIVGSLDIWESEGGSVTPKGVLVRDAMTAQVDTIAESETLASAAKKFAQANVGALTVCDAARHVRGILTDRDIVVHGIARGKDPNKTTVREVETRDPVCVSPETTLEKSAVLMARHSVRQLPVVDGQEVVGIITQADIARMRSEQV